MTREHFAHNARLRWESPIRAGASPGHFYLPPGRRVAPAAFCPRRAVSARLEAFWHSTAAPVLSAAGIVLCLWLVAVALGLAAGGW